MAETPAQKASPKDSNKFSIRETFSSVIIAFAMAFIFRAFVIEAFVIPTGSMAPTLLGQHMEFVGEQTGHRWQVGPWSDPGAGGGSGSPAASRVTVTDPMTSSDPAALLELGTTESRLPAHRVNATVDRLRAGDRILVLKYLPILFEPKRFDVVVFKNPTDPTQNYIKRLTGLPGEQLAIIDGDIFTRPTSSRPSAADLDGAGGTWALDGWTIARKPEEAQRAVWMPVHETTRAPINPVRDGFVWYSSPWRAVGSDGGALSSWRGLDGRTPEHTGPGPTRLSWDGEAWPIVDHYPYNERYRSSGQRLSPLMPPTFGVGDVRVRMGVEPVAHDLERLALHLTTRGHEFRAVIENGVGRIQMRPLEGVDADAWTTMDESEVGGLPAGRVTEVEFWHADQAVWLFVGGTRVAYAEYDWGPIERYELATDLPLDAQAPVIAPSTAYTPASPAIELTGPARLHRLALDRDLYYQTTRGGPASQLPVRGSHPALELALLADGHFFVCGDNSASSQDSRLLDDPSPWVAELDAPAGIVPGELMIGRAFFVYFPAVERRGPVPIPGFGRLRFIW